ncbi:BZ3500_MvSof-1268-A1-R1_Chr6-3g08705 [Microbotryum saponariae]|uniref:BZ3500_MvSof-1268-A1-R1_Chr6-3g08705 protein n=1 Tax=Microbotryum saponariae TaxID=289078 RepID=A0A2X0NMD1_9BASI|nr:BZ3500_MvSof-1268-A1-R1_Chr6-3g08705 [Microbotryum saponariae]SDA07306.1 BZ3501_MvSof-1269-A2-R1_Chr6-2g08408 [Microbotryum saponariae]
MKQQTTHEEKFVEFKLEQEMVEDANIPEGRLREPDVKFTPEEEAKLYRKVDWRILPILALLYLLSFMDRGAIGNARLSGLERDLGLSAQQYATCLSLFFITYFLFEIPSNLALTKIRPRYWLAFITLGWGIAMTLSGIVKNYAGLAICRTILGAFEAGLFPGVSLYLSFFYPRFIYQRRLAIFFSAATMAGAFAGLLAYGISFMAGTAGLGGWAWIFIIMGLLTVLAGGLAFFCVSDVPAKAKWLTEDERAWLVWRKASDGSSVGEAEGLHVAQIKSAFTDYHCWVALFFYISILVPLYSVGLFAPTLINSFGKWTRTEVQLLTVPMYVFACAYVLITSVYADRYRTRFPFLLAAQVLCLIGFTINIIPTAPVGVKFFGLFLCAAGAYGGVPSMISWLSTNLSGTTKRAVGTGLTLGIASLGGIISSNVYRTVDAPEYLLGHGVLIATSVMGIIASCVYAFLLKRSNAAKDRWHAEQNALPEHQRKVFTVQELRDMGDRAPEFYYTI